MRVSDFKNVVSFENWKASKVKIRVNFALLAPRKIGQGWIKCSSVIDAEGRSFVFPLCCECDLDRNRDQISHFLISVKFRGGVGKMSE